MPVGYRLFAGPDFFDQHRASRQTAVYDDAMTALKLDPSFSNQLLEEGVREALHVEPLRFTDTYSALLQTDMTLLHTKQGHPLPRWYAEAVVLFSGHPGLIKHRPRPGLQMKLRGSVASKSFKVKAMLPHRNYDDFVNDTDEKLRPLSEAFWRLGDTIHAFNAEMDDWLARTEEQRFIKFDQWREQATRERKPR